MVAPKQLIGALALLAAPGCIFVTESVTREVVVGVSESEPVDSGELVGWDISTRIDARMANVAVTVTRVQPCTRSRSEEIEVTSALGSGMRMLPFDLNDGLLAVVIDGGVAILFLPVTAVSWIVANREVANHHDTSTRMTRPLETIRSTCLRVAANVPVELTFPSGAVLTGTTGSDGSASFAIPETEPDDGTVTARVADQTREGAFFKTLEACRRAREEAFSRVTATAVEQRSQLLHALPTCADTRAHAWSLTVAAALDAVESHCESIKGLAGQVRSIDRELYDGVFVSEPDIAHCLDGSAVARHRRAVCEQQRHTVMLIAQRTNDLDERTQILTHLPHCDAPPAGH